VLDPEGAHLAALRRLGDFRGRRVLKLGCGDGRLTPGIARDAASVLAFDPDADAVERARQSLSAEIELEPVSFDLVVFRGRSDAWILRTSWTSCAIWSEQSSRAGLCSTCR